MRGAAVRTDTGLEKLRARDRGRSRAREELRRRHPDEFARRWSTAKVGRGDGYERSRQRALHALALAHREEYLALVDELSS